MGTVHGPEATDFVELPAPAVHLVEFGTSAMVYRVKFWVAEYAEEDAALDEVRTAIYYSFTRHGIEIPYPIQVEYARQETPATCETDLPRHSRDNVRVCRASAGGPRRRKSLFTALCDVGQQSLARPPDRR